MDSFLWKASMPWTTSLSEGIPNEAASRLLHVTPSFRGCWGLRSACQRLRSGMTWLRSVSALRNTSPVLVTLATHPGLAMSTGGRAKGGVLHVRAWPWGEGRIQLWVIVIVSPGLHILHFLACLVLLPAEGIIRSSFLNGEIRVNIILGLSGHELAGRSILTGCRHPLLVLDNSLDPGVAVSVRTTSRMQGAPLGLLAIPFHCPSRPSSSQWMGHPAFLPCIWWVHRSKLLTPPPDRPRDGQRVGLGAIHGLQELA
mmetsp:Transcript_101329/g.180094  ORF Transcript_101329/g.180094 Transcript_101329/m.180094 type:complete len:256 (-) Transcript_101329:35-802(-)